MPEKNNIGLKRIFTLFDSTKINDGTIIGSGIFIVPTTLALYLESSFLMASVWIIAGVVTLLGALSMAELGAAMPESGGQYVYLKEAYGPIWGFLYGWAAFTVINSASIAAVAVAFATYLKDFHAFTPMEVKLIAIFSIAAFTVLNSLHLKSGVWAQNVMTFSKVGVLFAFVILGLTLEGGSSTNFLPLTTAGSFSSFVKPFSLALVAVLWTYDGWIEITYVGGEIKNPGKNIPLSLLYSTILLILLYLAVNFVYVYLLSISGIATSELVASEAAQVILGPQGVTLVILAILLSTIGAVNVNVIAAPRIYHAMAIEKLFFSSAAKIHPVYGTPVASLLIQGIWASILVFTGTFDQLITYVVFTSWIFYAMSCGSVIVLRKTRPNMERPYKTWGYPYVPMIFIIFAIFLVGSTLIYDTRDSLIGIGLVLLGVPVYYLRVKSFKGRVS